MATEQTVGNTGQKFAWLTSSLLTRAAAKIRQNGVPPRRRSRYFDVVLEDGMRIPPKYLITEAAKLAGLPQFGSSSFAGGDGEANRVLRAFGYRIIDSRGDETQNDTGSAELARLPRKQNYFIATAAGAQPRRNLRRSILRPIALNQVSKVLTSAQIATLTSNGMMSFRAWGLRTTQKDRYGHISLGDTVVFYTKNDGVAGLNYPCTVLAKFRSSRLSRRLWDSSSHPYILILSRPTDHFLPWSQYNSFPGQKIKYVPNPHLLRDTARAAALDRFFDIYSSVNAENPGNAALVETVEPERRNVESYEMSVEDTTRVVERVESTLVEKFTTWLKVAKNLSAARNKIPAPGGTGWLFSDLYIEERNVLIEAKGTTQRAAFRMAIGQLADYRRFLKNPKCAILLPTCPSSDLIDLAHVEDIAIIYPDRGAFTSTKQLW